METGTRLGPYEILEPLGAGGMGEVWLAKDTRLGRQVAIKVLPSSVSDDPDGLARLEQEARILAQLEHPNVAAVYGLERAPAEDGCSPLLHLVMQYAQGETLADWIGGADMPVHEALEIARQVAAGLGAAHDKGIVHRDLKPANVMLAQGTAGAVQVKVLDFGLAKAHGGRDSGANVEMSASPTMAVLTADGFILGTAAYMSPEQARGKATDRRTDVWAFGCLLFEMLTGRQAFAGETVSDIMAAILKEEPDWSILPEAVPATVRRGLRRCLNKDPEQRPYDVRDVVLGFVEEPAAETERTADSTAMTNSRAAWPGTIAVLIGGLAVGYVVARTGSAGHGAAVQPALYRQMTTHSGVEAFPNLSGDGEWIVYASPADGDWDIYLQGVGGENPINLTADEPADDKMPAFSPDGRFIAFRSERLGGGLFVMGRTGDSVRRIAEQGYNPAWSPDGTRVVVATHAIEHTPYDRVGATSELVIIGVDSGALTRLETGDAVQPDWSPDGRRLVYWGLRVGGGQRDLWTVDAAGGQPVRLTDDEATDWTPTWSHDSRAVLFSSDRAGTLGLWRIELDPSSGTPGGSPQLVVASGGGEWLAYPSVADDGESLLYAATKSAAQTYQLDLSPDFRSLTADPRRLTNDSRNTFSPDLSPDGSLLVFYSGHGQQEDLFLQPLDGSPLVRLTHDAAKDRVPRFSPDGTRVAFVSDRDGTYELFMIPIDGSAARRISSQGTRAGMPSWDPEGTRVVSGFGLRNDLLATVRIDESTPVDPVELKARLPEGVSFLPHGWSADGRHLVGNFVDRLTGVPGGIAIVDVTSGDYEQLTDFGLYSTWLSDSRHIAFRTADEMWVVDSHNRESWPVLAVSPNLLVDVPSGWRGGPSVVYTMLSSGGDLWMASW